MKNYRTSFKLDIFTEIWRSFSMLDRKLFKTIQAANVWLISYYFCTYSFVAISWKQLCSALSLSLLKHDTFLYKLYKEKNLLTVFSEKSKPREVRQSEKLLNKTKNIIKKIWPQTLKAEQLTEVTYVKFSI